jgi:xylan 1,4-beta-xylosidase
MLSSAILTVTAALVPTVLGQNQRTYVDYSVEGNPQLDHRNVAEINTTFPTCSSALLQNTIVCNSSYSSWERAQALISLFTFEELVNNTANTAPGVPRLGLPPYQVWNEGLHGIDRFTANSFPGEWSWGTSFPSPILSMASLNSSLVRLSSFRILVSKPADSPS